MPQKPLKPPPAMTAKKVAPNRHGKIAKTKKGRYDKPAKRKSLKDKEAEDRELTKAINAENEARAADVAANAGGKLNVIKPPVNATKDDLKKAKRPGIPWGASSK